MIIFLSILLLIFFVDYKMDHFLNNVLEYEPGLQDTTAGYKNEERIHIVSPQSTSYAFCPSLIKELPQWIENLAEHHPQSRENRNHNCEKNIQDDPIICAVLEVMLRKIFEKQECIFHFLLTILSFRSNIPRQLLLEAASPFTINKLLNKIQTYCILVTCLSSSCIAPTMDWAVIQQESSSIDNADFEAYCLYCMRIFLARNWSESSSFPKEIDLSAHTGYPETLFLLSTPSPTNKRPKHAIVPLMESESHPDLSVVEFIPMSFTNPCDLSV